MSLEMTSKSIAITPIKYQGNRFTLLRLHDYTVWDDLGGGVEMINPALGPRGETNRGLALADGGESAASLFMGSWAVV